MLAGPDPSGCRFVAVASSAASHGLFHLAAYTTVKHAVVKRRTPKSTTTTTASTRARASTSTTVGIVERSAQASLTLELDELLAQRAHLERDLTGGERDALLTLRGAAERLSVRHESAQRLLGELRTELEESRRRPTGPTPDQLGRAADEADAAARAAAREHEDVVARLSLAGERLTALEQSLAEREGLPPAARALAEEGERLVLQVLEVESGSERSVAAALGHRASAVLADDAHRALELVAKAQSAGLGSVLVLIGQDPGDLVRLPVVARDELLASTVPAVTDDGIGWDPLRGELWFSGETAEAVLLELEARRRELRAEVEALAARVGEADGRAEEADARARAAAEALAPVAHLRSLRGADPRRLERLLAGAERLDETLRVAAAAAARLESPLAERSGRLAEHLRGVAVRESELRRTLTRNFKLAGPRSGASVYDLTTHSSLFILRDGVKRVVVS